MFECELVILFIISLRFYSNPNCRNSDEEMGEVGMLKVNQFITCTGTDAANV